MNFAPKCTSRHATQTPLDSSLDAPQMCRRVRSSEPLKLKRLTKRVVIKPDGRYLIYYERA
jgi:hypothetical protein